MRSTFDWPKRVSETDNYQLKLAVETTVWMNS
jgi:hypothetical protein